MSEAYDQYLNEHISTVKKGWQWLKDHLPEDLCTGEPIDIYEIDKVIDRHDESKTKPDEYYSYDAWFYGGKQSFADKLAFQTAFLKHIHRNPHHWQYWILIHDDPDEPETIIEMPVSYIFEMICDWWNFSWRKGDLYEIFSWWDEHKDYIKLEKHTRKIVEKILNGMKIALNEEKEEGTEENFDDSALAHHGILGQKCGHLAHEEKEDENKFGLPELKKYPMPDPDHVKSAIRFFNYVDPKHEKELAEAILERMKEYDMSFDDFGVGDENRFKNYIPKADQKDS